MGNHPSGEGDYALLGHDTTHHKSKLTEGVRGLANAVGQYHCFLNVCVQMLYHLSAFRETFMECVSHKHFSEPCIFCELRDLFVSYRFCDEAVLSAEKLRVCLHKLYEGERKFELECMADAEEAFEAILSWLHMDYRRSCALQWVDYERQLTLYYQQKAKYPQRIFMLPCAPAFASPSSKLTPLCMAHDVFGLYILDVKVCENIDAHFCQLQQLYIDLCAEESMHVKNNGSASHGRSLLEVGPAIGGVSRDTLSISTTYRVYVQELIDFWQGARIESLERNGLTELEADIRANATFQKRSLNESPQDDAVAQVLGVDHTVRRAALTTKEGLFALLIRDSYARERFQCPCASLDSSKIPTESKTGAQLYSRIRAGCSADRKSAHITRFLLKRPRAFMVSLAWPSAEATKEQIENLFAILPKVFDLGHAMIVPSIDGEQAILKRLNSGADEGAETNPLRCYSKRQAQDDCLRFFGDGASSSHNRETLVSPSSSSSSPAARSLETKTPSESHPIGVDVLADDKSPFIAISGIPQKLWPPKSTYSWLMGHTASFPLQLTGLICFYGAHYVAFVPSPQDSEQWLQLNDTSVGVVGTWDQLVEKCVKGRLQPTLLAFQPYGGQVPSSPIPTFPTHNDVTSPSASQTAPQRDNQPPSRGANTRRGNDSNEDREDAGFGLPNRDGELEIEYTDLPEISYPYNVRTTYRR